MQRPFISLKRRYNKISFQRWSMSWKNGWYREYYCLNNEDASDTQAIKTLSDAAALYLTMHEQKKNYRQ